MGQHADDLIDAIWEAEWEGEIDTDPFYSQRKLPVSFTRRITKAKERNMALVPLKKASTNAAAPAASTPGTPRPTPRATPAARPAAPVTPARRGDFLRGVVPGADRHDPHFKAHGRYVAQLEEAQMIRSREGHDIFLGTFKVLEVLQEGSVKRVGDTFNIFLSSKNPDVYPGAMAAMVIGLCKPTEEELAADLDLPEAEQTLMPNLLDAILDGNLNGYKYDLQFTGAVSSKGKEYTAIRYGDVIE